MNRPRRGASCKHMHVRDGVETPVAHVPVSDSDAAAGPQLHELMSLRQ
jgi:hypothetical protein